MPGARSPSGRRPRSAIGFARRQLAAGENELGAAVDRRLPRRLRRRGEFGVWPRVGVEMAVGIDAAHQHCRIAEAVLAGIGRHHLDEQHDAAVGAAIGARAMDDGVVDDRHLAGTERQVERARAVEFLGDVLAARENARRVLGIGMRQNAPLMRARNDAQTPLARAAFREGQRAEGENRLDAAIGGVLVPAGEGLAVRLLDAPGHAPAQDIGSEEILEDVEDARMLGDVDDPGAKKMGFALQLLDVLGVAPLEILEPRSVVRDLGGREDFDGTREAIALETLDRIAGQYLGHRSLRRYPCAAGANDNASVAARQSRPKLAPAATADPQTSKEGGSTMRRNRGAFILGIAAGLMALAIGAGAARAACEPKVGHPPLVRKGTLIGAINPTVAPIQYVDEDGNIVGLDVELGNAIAERLCLKMLFESVQFATMIPGLQDGRFDMIDSFMFYTPERASQVIMIPYGASTLAIVVPKANTDQIKGLDYFSGKKFAVELGTVDANDAKKASDDLVKAGKPPIEVHTFNTYADVLQALRAGQADGAFIGTEQAYYYQKKGEAFFRIALTGYDPHAEALAFKDKGLAETVAGVLNAMKADGSFDKLFKSYHHCTLPGPYKITTGPQPAPECTNAPE